MGLISSGTTIFDNGAYNVGGSMVLVSSATASSSASIEFTLGNYKEYKFFFVNMHPASDDAIFLVNFSTDNGSNYNITKTTTYFRAFHLENDTNAGVGYQTGQDLAQSTSFQHLTTEIGSGADESCSGYFTLFNPSSTTFVKHFMSNMNSYNFGNVSVNDFAAGYANTTSALTNIKFQMDVGNIDDGTILCYGIN
jgi:hypothetical protein